MINGVLVERTVKDVKPALQTNSEGLKKVLEELVKQYKKQQDEMEKWKARTVGRTEAFLLTSIVCRRRTIFRWYSSRRLCSTVTSGYNGDCLAFYDMCRHTAAIRGSKLHVACTSSNTRRHHVR